MALSDGDPADPVDIWHRPLTSSNYWRKADGTLHNRAFTGKAISPPRDGRPWSYEFSGRLLSLVQDAHAESREFCTSRGMEFAGVVFQMVCRLRTIARGRFPTDVVYTPKSDDTAHADIVFSKTEADDLPELRDWLQSTLIAVRPDASGPTLPSKIDIGAEAPNAQEHGQPSTPSEAHASPAKET